MRKELGAGDPGHDQEIMLSFFKVSIFESYNLYKDHYKDLTHFYIYILINDFFLMLAE